MKRKGSIQNDKDHTDESNKHKLSIFETGLTLVAATIGGEILAIPYAMNHLGLVLGLVTMILMAVASWVSNAMYLKVKDLTPC